MFSVKATGIAEADTTFALFGATSEGKKDAFIRRCAEEFRDSAKVHFSPSWLADDFEPVEVGIEARQGGYAVYADGEEVAFIEFGAGVYYNGAESYKGHRPPEVARIGEYGQGKGKRNTWAYYDENRVLHFTHGNPPANAMYYALQDTISKLQTIAKEIFT